MAARARIRAAPSDRAVCGGNHVRLTAARVRLDRRFGREPRYMAKTLTEIAALRLSKQCNHGTASSGSCLSRTHKHRGGACLHGRGQTSRSYVETRQTALSLDRKRRRLRFQIHANDRGDAAMNGRQEHSSRGRQCGQRMSSSSHLHNCSSHCIDVRLVEQPTRAGVNVPVCKYGTGDPNRNASLPYRIEIKSNSHSKFKHRIDRAKA